MRFVYVYNRIGAHGYKNIIDKEVKQLKENEERKRKWIYQFI